MSLTRSALSALSLAAGVVLGVCGTVGTYLFVHRNTAVYETREALAAGGIVIPKGTKLIHDREMSEGFDRLALYVNVDPVLLQAHFRRSVDPRGMLVIPYWLTGPVMRCPTLATGDLPRDPAALQGLIVATRLRPRAQPSPCPPGEVCVEDCEDGSVCAACERLIGEALDQLVANGTDDAAQAAAALVLDERMGWDAGAALTLAHANARLGRRVLPYLQPHVGTSSLARMIVDCVHRGHPCI